MLAGLVSLCATLGAGPLSTATDWRAADLAVITSQLSPAGIVHTTRQRLTLFAGLGKWGLSAPTNVLLHGTSGPTVLRRSDGPLQIPTNLRAPWMLVWFHGGSGWEQWDAPWLVVLQRRPTSLVLDSDGLHIAGPGPLGHVVLMPLRGLAKPETREWPSRPSDLAKECALWARVLREYPLDCLETTRVDAQAGDVVVRDRFRWLSIRDDWNTRPLKLAPLSPTLALSLQGGRIPASVSGRIYWTKVSTSFGPYSGITGADGYEVRFKVLKYLAETEKEPVPDTSRPVVAEALTRLRLAMKESFTSPDGLFHQDFGDPPNFRAPPPQDSDGGNTCWALMAAQYYCRALPYVSADLLPEARARLRRYFADWVLQEARYKPFRGKLLLVGPGIGTWGGYDDAGKFSSNVLITLWTYARYTGDYALIKERWPLIKRLFVTPRECTWRGYGRDAIAEMGDEAAPALAMARLAHAVGDRATYAYASYIFARELVHHVVKHTGSEYFVKNQPWHTMESMPPKVYLTNLWGDTAGWQIDGPTWPRETGERQYTNRWVRFGDPDVARFHRDHLQDLARKELDELLASGRFTRERPGTKDDPHILPGIARLRSLLLNETPEQLDAVLPVGAQVHSNSGIAAHCMAFLRVSRTPAAVPLIPRAQAGTNWTPGLEQDKPDDEPVLTFSVHATQASGAAGEPALCWWGWAPPKKPNEPGGERWSFGQVWTDRSAKEVQSVRLSWLTAAVVVNPARAGGAKR